MKSKNLIGDDSMNCQRTDLPVMDLNILSWHGQGVMVITSEHLDLSLLSLSSGLVNVNANGQH